MALTEQREAHASADGRRHTNKTIPVFAFDNGGDLRYNGCQTARESSLSRQREEWMQASKRARHTEPSQQEVAASIAAQLHIADKKGQAQLFQIVRDLGRTQARQLAGEALQIEAQGSVSSPQERFLQLVQTKGKPKEQRHARAVAKRIAEQLQETEEQPLLQIQRIVQILGEEQALFYVQETVRIEEAGGMMRADGSRRRTPGGVYFTLLRSAVPREIRYKLFPQVGKQEARDAQGQPPLPQAEAVPLTPLSWNERHTIIKEAEKEKGTASTLKITLIGRPGRVIDRGTCIVTTMQESHVPSLPKGLPTPEPTPTTYTVYISAKQWRKVEDAIKETDDVLILEGFPQLDAQTTSIAVFVTNATTKKLQMAQKEQQA